MLRRVNKTNDKLLNIVQRNGWNVTFIMAYPIINIDAINYATPASERLMYLNILYKSIGTFWLQHILINGYGKGFLLILI